ncbi:LysR family transcriptional regulator [Massilia arenosa]|uniref:LysR family transcriptional regulator n=1 Tax=Zemynaea arenosa TaxID=2561931 RepID=A0A4Y9S2P8_9BURK|nr:LysR substrate-binding domain-containing protein [Massilia arenosa]TFW15453.1 LysR family transcriptional regulator [Massilia arenosa]
MSTPLFPLDLMKTLVAGVQAGGFAKAAEKIGRTQSAISLQMKKLEELAGTELFEKQGRVLALTPSGETMYHYAQRMLELNEEAVTAVRGAGVAGEVKVGMSMDFEHTFLPNVLARFGRAHPQIVLDLHVDRNTALRTKAARKELDVAVLFSNEVKAEQTVGQVPMAWIGQRDLAWQRDEPLPLLLLEAPCVFRDAALRALDAAGIRWRIAVTSPSLGGLWAAARAGLGLTVRTALAVPAELANLGDELALPALPEIGVCVVEAARTPAPPVALMTRTVTEVLHSQLDI